MAFELPYGQRGRFDHSTEARPMNPRIRAVAALALATIAAGAALAQDKNTPIA